MNRTRPIGDLLRPGENVGSMPAPKRTTRYRVVVEFETTHTAEGVRAECRNSLAHGRLAECVPGEIVYVATDIAETAVLSHDGKTLTRG